MILQYKQTRESANPEVAKVTEKIMKIVNKITLLQPQRVALMK
jgi:hypothetical protein